MDIPGAVNLSHLRGLGCTRLLFLLLFFALLTTNLRAEQAAVSRDGTLLFQEPSGGAAVLDILPRGTRLELVRRGEQWSEVLIVESDTRGFIRTTALISLAEATAPLEAGFSLEEASPLYESLRRDLDESDSKIEKIERTLDQLEKMVRIYSRLDSGMLGASRESGKPEAWSETLQAGCPLGYSLGFQLFSGAYLKEKDFTAGGAVSWFPKTTAGFGIELEGGYISLKAGEKGTSLNLSLLYPLPLKSSRLLPFVLGGGGAVRMNAAGSGSVYKTRATAHLGLGALYRLSDGFSLRAELRGQRCRDQYDGRGSLSLLRGF